MEDYLQAFGRWFQELQRGSKIALGFLVLIVACLTCSGISSALRGGGSVEPTPTLSMITLIWLWHKEGAVP